MPNKQTGDAAAPSDGTSQGVVYFSALEIDAIESLEECASYSMLFSQNGSILGIEDKFFSIQNFNFELLKYWF